ncbi:MAG: carboxypeptidase regulatory-like domain-containing protein [Gemmatimonadaceae bacterium]
MRFRPLLPVVLLPQLALAQAQDTAHRAPGVTVSGVVRDSVARIPLAGAIVQLVAADSPVRFARTAVSDSLGRFTLSDVPVGRHVLGFFHPILDSLGVEAPLREVYVDGRQAVRADLGVPSPARLRAAICGPQSADSGAVVVGVVRDARDGAPAAGATVTGEWLEFSFTRSELVSRIPRVVVTTGENGWFAICNVPSAGAMVLIASRGAESTGLIEVQVSAEGFVRRELYVGPARAIVTGDTAERADTVSLLTGRGRMRGGTLNGTVVAAAGGRPLAGAQVSITSGPQTRANERGAWTLVDVPVGTQMLEVRALGHYPERRAVDIVPGAASVSVTLSTLKAVLDTVRVAARRLRGGNPSGFSDRRRTGMGRYLTPEDIARRPAILTSDIFRTVSGIRLGYASDTLASDMTERLAPDSIREPSRHILMRGISGNWCPPAIYVDGLRMPSITADDIDAWVRPNDVAGIEIYSEASVPSEYRQGRSGCGSVVIWTK